LYISLSQRSPTPPSQNRARGGDPASAGLNNCAPLRASKILNSKEKIGPDSSHVGLGLKVVLIGKHAPKHKKGAHFPLGKLSQVGTVIGHNFVIDSLIKIRYSRAAPQGVTFCKKLFDK
jgi:hypothetical protein